LIETVMEGMVARISRISRVGLHSRMGTLGRFQTIRWGSLDWDVSPWRREAMAIGPADFLVVQRVLRQGHPLSQNAPIIGPFQDLYHDVILPGCSVSGTAMHLVPAEQLTARAYITTSVSRYAGRYCRARLVGLGITALSPIYGACGQCERLPPFGRTTSIVHFCVRPRPSS